MTRKKSDKKLDFLKLAGKILSKLLAIVGLASLFEKTIDWVPVIQQVIDVYQSFIYPIWEFLFGWAGLDMHDRLKDIYTLNVLLITSAAGSNNPSESSSSLTYYINTARQGWKNAREALSLSAKRPYIDRLNDLTWALVQAVTLLGISVLFVFTGALFYMLLAFHYSVRAFNSKSQDEKKESRKRLWNLAVSTVQVAQGFLLLLGLNYAIVGIS